MPIKVIGTADLRVSYEVELDMTEEKFDNLDPKDLHDLIDGGIDWHETLRNAEVTDIEVDDVEEFE